MYTHTHTHTHTHIYIYIYNFAAFVEAGVLLSHHNQARSVLIKDILLGCVAGPLNSSVTDILRECGSNLVSLYLIIFYTI